jgi:glycosyltransferase involved in cell wall biosynthesis
MIPEAAAGSEQILIDVAEGMARRGWEVTVFNTCGERIIVIRGVRYIPVKKIRPLHFYDVMILWRDERLASLDLRCDKAYLWMHNLVDACRLSNELCKGVAAVIALSKFHRGTMTALTEDKAWVTRNAVTIKPRAVSVPRKRRCIYASAPDRGLELLLQLWPLIRERVPDAELEIYYGWSTWEFFNGGNPWARQWRRRIERLMVQPGVTTTFPRIGPDELRDRFSACAVWLYPTEFEETSCINAMLAQVYGAIPVTCAVGALSETVRWGDLLASTAIYSQRTAQNEFIEAVFRRLTTEQRIYREKMMSWAADHFSVDALCLSWEKRFESDLASTSAA